MWQLLHAPAFLPLLQWQTVALVKYFVRTKRKIMNTPSYLCIFSTYTSFIYIVKLSVFSQVEKVRWIFFSKSFSTPYQPKLKHLTHAHACACAHTHTWMHHCVKSYFIRDPQGTRSQVLSPQCLHPWGRLSHLRKRRLPWTALPTTASCCP